MSSLLEQASLVVTPNGTKASKLYSVKPTDGSGDMTVVRATTATRVNSSGLIESSAINVPRLDYTDSTCPSLLVEPQRTNLLLRSEEFDSTYWLKSNVSVTANNTSSPSGTMTADLVENTSNAGYINNLSFAGSTGSVYSFSFYIKNNTSTNTSVLVREGVSAVTATINWSGANISSIINTIGSISFTALTNGWFRITGTYTALENPQKIRIYPQAFSGTSSVFIWGAQLEAGSNATSYIPTTTASVTRNADLISKTGISSLIGQTEGTLYADINFKNWEVNSRILAIGDGTTSNRIVILKDSVANTFRFLITTGGVTQSDILSSSLPIGNYKIAAAYKNNDVAFYINGSQIGTDNLATIPVCSNLYLGTSEYSVPSTTLILNDSIKSAALWKTRLTNAELATLTTL